MKLKPEDKPTIIFRTEMGDYDVSLFSSVGIKKYYLAQKALNEMKEMMLQCEIKKEAIASLHNFLIENECIPGCQMDADGNKDKVED